VGRYRDLRPNCELCTQDRVEWGGSLRNPAWMATTRGVILALFLATVISGTGSGPSLAINSSMTSLSCRMLYRPDRVSRCQSLWNCLV
jgi:hypothetical protein